MYDVWYRQAFASWDRTAVEFLVTNLIAIAAWNFGLNLFPTVAHVVSPFHSSKRWHSRHSQGQRGSTPHPQEKRPPVRKLSKLGPSWLWRHQVIYLFLLFLLKDGEGLKKSQHTSSSSSWSSSGHSSSAFSSWLWASVSSEPFSVGAVLPEAGAAGLTRLLERAAWTIVSWDVDRLRINHYIKRMSTVSWWVLIGYFFPSANDTNTKWSLFGIQFQIPAARRVRADATSPLVRNSSALTAS